MSWLFTSCGPSIGFPLGLTGLISLLSKGLSGRQESWAVEICEDFGVERLNWDFEKSKFYLWAKSRGEGFAVGGEES